MSTFVHGKLGLSEPNAAFVHGQRDLQRHIDYFRAPAKVRDARWRVTRVIRVLLVIWMIVTAVVLWVVANVALG